MPAKSLTRKLSALQEKKAALDAEIKKIEQEQAQQLRKEKQERARIIGLAMLRMMEDNAAADWTEERLLELVSPFVINGKERRFLGLDNDGKSPSIKKRSAGSSATARKASSKTSVSSAETKSKKKSSGKASSKSKAKPLPEPIDEDDLSNEFNL